MATLVDIGKEDQTERNGFQMCLKATDEQLISQQESVSTAYMLKWKSKNIGDIKR